MSISDGRSRRTCSATGPAAANAGAGAAIMVMSRRAATRLAGIGVPSRCGDELDHVDERFEMRIGEDQPPAPLADPLEQGDHVAILVAAVAEHPLLVAELEGAEEDQP